MKSFLASVALATLTAGLAPQAVFADGRSFQGSFAVAYSGRPNTTAVSYCGATGRASRIEAHGNGSTSLGALAFTLFKTVGGGGVARLSHVDRS